MIATTAPSHAVEIMMNGDGQMRVDRALIQPSNDVKRNAKRTTAVNIDCMVALIKVCEVGNPSA